MSLLNLEESKENVVQTTEGQEIQVEDISREQTADDINPDFQYSVFFEDSFTIVTVESRRRHLKKHIKWLLYELLICALYGFTAFLFGYICLGCDFKFGYF